MYFTISRIFICMHRERDCNAITDPHSASDNCMSSIDSWYLTTILMDISRTLSINIFNAVVNNIPKVNELNIPLIEK